MAKRKFYYRVVDDDGLNRPARFRSFCRDEQTISLAQARALYRVTGKRIELFYAPLTRRICRESHRWESSEHARRMPFDPPAEPMTKAEVGECVCEILDNFDETPDGVIGEADEADPSRPVWLTRIR